MEKPFYSFTYILFFSVLTSIGCKKPCIRNEYTFKVNGCIIQPDKDSIKVGDTIFFSSIVPFEMTDITNGIKVNYGSAVNFGSDMGVVELKSQNTASGAVYNFDYIQQKGQIYTDSSLSPSRVKQLKYAEEDGNYKLQFGLVALKQGVFSISIADMPNVARNCDRAVIYLQFDSSLDTHLHYLKDIYYGGGQIDPLDLTHTYSFKVY